MPNAKSCRSSNLIWLSSLAFLLLLAHWPAVCFGGSHRPMQESNVEQESSQVEQETLFVEVLVKDADGQPVSDATVTPWALGSAVGTGLWTAETIAGVDPKPVITDSRGMAKVAYPKYASLSERVSTATVSVSVNHPDHPYIGGEQISVSLRKAHQIRFPVGVALEVRALVDGKVDNSGQVHIISTSGKPGAIRPTSAADGIIHIPPMAQGKGELLLIRLDGGKPTHFSSIVRIDIDPTKNIHKLEVKLEPAVSVQGKLSDNVSRPVKNGRVKVSTINSGTSWNEISWGAWANVQADGTFRIESWPREQPIQLVALCDGFYAESGKKPPMVKTRQALGSYMRAQVFALPEEAEIVVQMKPMVNCQVEIKDAFGKPIKDIVVSSNPNVGWWNGGAEIYCYPLTGTAQWLVTGKYEPASQEGLFEIPFAGRSNEQGKAEIQLPVGRFLLRAFNEKYQLPIKVGSRTEKIRVREGDSMDIALLVQPKGLEVLGDWEDLCGLVFG